MKKRILLMHLGIFALIALLVWIGCPIFRITGIVCPTCGVTRGWLAFFRGDIERAFQYHALFPLAPLFLFVIGHRSSFLRKWKLLADGFLYTGAALFFVYNVLRWLGLIIMP